MPIFNEKIAEKTARELLKTNSVRLSPADMFTWASGIKSPIYCDNRRLLSFPESRAEIAQSLAELISKKYPEAEAIAGVATGAIAIGILTAEHLRLPFAYVRAEAKKHGMGNRIEGRLEKGQKVIVIEDLISTGGSSLNAVEALREAECCVLGMVAVFSYELPVSVTNFQNAQCELTVLSNYDTLIYEAVRKNYIRESDLEILKNWKSQF
jgi:orotate phosphoribosyltransferase